MHGRYLIKTLGCKANFYDSQLIEAELKKQGWSPAMSASDEGVSLCIVNSCTVTDEADRQSRKMAARLGRDNPEARVVVTGCSAEVDPERLAASKGIHYVVGNRDKPQMVQIILDRLAQDRVQGREGAVSRGEVLGVAEGYSELRSRHPMDREWPTADDSLFTPPEEAGSSQRTRAFLKIQDGCNSFCTYCIIPYGRGPARSLRIEEVVSQVRALVDRGVKEIVLTGINLGDYGVDWSPEPSAEPQLVPLVRAILSQTELPRLRVSSLDPVEIEPALLDLMRSEPRFCPHFHVSLQSPHSRILRLMKRKYHAEHVETTLERIAALPAPPGGAFVGMDVITGFPGETEEEFDWTFETLSRLPWSRLHVFPYSERAGTPATRLPGAVSPMERARRADRLRELSLARLEQVYRKAWDQARSGRDGELDTILLEGEARGPHALKEAGYPYMAGYTSNYLRVLVRKDSFPPVAPEEFSNRELTIRIEGVLVDAPSGDVAFEASFVRALG